MTPRIAIPVPTLGDSDYNALNWPAYADAIRDSGGEPLRIELTLSDHALAECVAACDGVLLPGSPADVDTRLYGQEREEFTAEPDFARERVDRGFLEEAWVGKKPLLGICFGMQMMNVWRGGTLVQDLAPLPVNHSAGRSVVTAHGVVVEPESRLAGVVGGTASARRMINSSHHQAVGIAGDGLRIVGRSTEDGVVEAIESDGAGSLFLGVQWHPERTFSGDDWSRAIFGTLISSATVFSRGLCRPGHSA